MKTVSHREGLLSACQLATVAVPTRTTKPVLQNLKMIADDGRCTLMATDLELGIRLEIRGLTVLEPGEALLPASRFIAILRESQDQELTIEADANACTIRGNDLEFEMPGEDPVNFPDLPTFTEDRYHELTAGTLRQMIHRTLFAVAEENARFAMTGILWELEGDAAKLVGTDGRRLAVVQGPAKAVGGHTTHGTTPIVPSKAMTLLDRNLQDEAEVVRVCLRPNEVLFRTERAVVYSRLVEGRFPNYKDVIPKKQTVKVPLTVPGLMAAVRQAAIMADEETRKVAFTFSKNRLTLQAQGANTGRSKVEMAVAYDHKPISINFNPQFVVDMLKVLPGEADLVLELVDGASQAMFRSGADYSYVVMPLS